MFKFVFTFLLSFQIKYSLTKLMKVCFFIIIFTLNVYPIQSCLSAPLNFAATPCHSNPSSPSTMPFVFLALSYSSLQLQWVLSYSAKSLLIFFLTKSPSSRSLLSPPYPSPHSLSTIIPLLLLLYHHYHYYYHPYYITDNVFRSPPTRC